MPTRFAATMMLVILFSMVLIPVSSAGELERYFPTDVGATWNYEITINRDNEPLWYNETIWPLGSGGVRYANRGRFIYPANQKTFDLTLQVSQKVSQQGPLSYPVGVEVEILKDELGIFSRHVTHVFWAIDDSGTVLQLEMFDRLAMPGSSFGMEDGHAVRPLFFNRPAGIQIGLGENPADTLLFLGVNDRVDGFRGSACLHFRREVEADDKGTSAHLDKGFTEHRFYVKDKGLGRLVQEINDEWSMIWTLKSVTSSHSPSHRR